MRSSDDVIAFEGHTGDVFDAIEATLAKELAQSFEDSDSQRSSSSAGKGDDDAETEAEAEEAEDAGEPANARVSAVRAADKAKAELLASVAAARVPLPPAAESAATAGTGVTPSVGELVEWSDDD